MDEEFVFQQLGRDGITALVAAFYRRVRSDDILAPLYPDDDWDAAEQRLRDFLLFRIGADTTYLEQRGHPRLRMRHAPFSIGTTERDRWLKLMNEAMDETNVDSAPRQQLEAFFTQVADFLRNHPG